MKTLDEILAMLPPGSKQEIVEARDEREFSRKTAHTAEMIGRLPWILTLPLAKAAHEIVHNAELFKLNAKTQSILAELQRMNPETWNFELPEFMDHTRKCRLCLENFVTVMCCILYSHFHADDAQNDEQSLSA